MNAFTSLRLPWLTVASLIVALLVVGSCNRKESLDPENTPQSTITVSEAKIYVEEVIRQGAAFSQPYATHKFLWNQAIVRNNNGAFYVQVPIEEANQVRHILYNPISKKYLSAPKIQVLVYKDSKDAYKIAVMELVPTGDYAESHAGYTANEDFSGTQFLRLWDGTPLTSYTFQQGKIIERLNPVTGGNKAARSKGCSIWYRQYIFVGCSGPQGQAIVVGSTAYYPATSGITFPPTPNFTDPFSYPSCEGFWQTNGFPSEYEICTNDPYDPFNPINPSNPSDLFQPDASSGLTPLLELRNNKLGLFGPCPGLTDNWRNLITFKAPPSIYNKLYRLTRNAQFQQNIPVMQDYFLPTDWYVQTIRNASGVAINLDNFSVFMNDLPTVNGNRLSLEEFVTYVRLNLNSFVDTNLASFSPHGYTGENETGIWQSGNPLGAVIDLDILGPDNGSVIVSEVNLGGYGSAGWAFTTIHDPWNGDHPVSGTRIFGCYESGDGYVFYIQGADRLSNWLHDVVGVFSKAAQGQAFQFTQADGLWMSFQTKLAAFLNSHGSQAQIRTPVANRPNWSKVKEALDNNRSLSTVPCP